MPLDKDALASLRLDRENDAGRYRESPLRRHRRWIVIAAALLVAVLLLMRWSGAAVEVQTAVIEAPAGSADGSVLNATGYVVARRLATVSSKVTGRIDEVLFEEGMQVSQGQVLARLDPSTAMAEHAVAQSDLTAAHRRLREIEVRLADARRTHERNLSLVERKLVAQSMLDASEAEVGALAARLEAERANVDVAESALALRKQALDDHEIRAPFAGVVISKDAQPGEIVSPMSAGGGYTRTGVATIVDMDSREIEVDVNEAYVNRVHEHQRVQAMLDAYPDWPIPGHVIGIVPTADRQKATVKVRIAFDGLDPRILPDMGVKVSFFDPEGMARGTTELKVPEQAVVRDGDTARVWIVADGKVSQREVKTGDTSDGQVAVVSGLEGGEVVVVDPPGRLRDGAAVTIKGA